MAPLERIQKVVSNQGLLSRKETEAALVAGYIRVNGVVVTELGTRVDTDRDHITIDPAFSRRKKTYIAFHKPRGIVTNLPQAGEQEIKDLLPEKLKSLSAIGRLDKESEGLILLSDDGVFAKKILQPDDLPHEREYLVRIDRPLTEDMKHQLETGVQLLSTVSKPTTVIPVSTVTFRIIMVEGKNRQIRRMLQCLGARVVFLKRIRFHSIILGALAEGDYRHLTRKEQHDLGDSL
ncbi:MAG: pseudouridine synthase [Candidatus Margulisiibacteriota bacterium]